MNSALCAAWSSRRSGRIGRSVEECSGFFLRAVPAGVHAAGKSVSYDEVPPKRCVEEPMNNRTVELRIN